MKGLAYLQKYEKYTILFLRISLLFVLFARGRPKLMGGMERWIGLGQAMSVYGIEFSPAFRGFMAAYAESIAVILIALGILTRYNAFFLAFTLFTAMITKMVSEPGIEKIAELGSAYLIFIVAFALMISGAGPVLNLDKKLFGKEL